MHAAALDQLRQPFDVLINAISAGLHGEMPALDATLVAPASVAYDMVYGTQPTPFMRWAEGLGAAAVCDGLGMLVEQAAEAFQVWRGARTPRRCWPGCAAARPRGTHFTNFVALRLAALAETR
jgi:shikimate dehydrogenase